LILVPANSATAELALIEEWLRAREEELVGLLQELIRARSVNPPGDEQEMASIVASALAPATQVRTFEPASKRVSVVARLEGASEGANLLCNAHTDTVGVDPSESWEVDPFAGVRRDGYVLGRGAVDHKAPVAALVFAALCLAELGLIKRGSLTLVFDADEEGGGHWGAIPLYQSWQAPVDVALYAAPSSRSPDGQRFFSMGQDNVITASLGVVRVQVECRAEVAYLAARPWRYPAEAALELASHVLQRSAPETGPAPAWLGENRSWRLAGCHDGLLQWERVVLPREDLARVQAETVELLEQLARELEIAVSVDVTDVVAPVECEADHPLVVAIAEEAEAVTDRRPSIGPLAAVTGMSRISEGLGVPCVMFGFGELEMAHSENERILVRDLVDSALVYARSLSRLLA
jgi:acetylornithine deacetylase/succinyl-diaminopimelate desuccinylase-like protein